MNQFEEKTIHTKLYKEGFINIEGEFNSEREVSKIRFEYTYKNKKYYDSITLFKSYDKITCSNYTNGLIEKKNFSSSYLKYFDTLQKEEKNIDHQDITTMTEFILRQMEEKTKKNISIFAKGSMERKIKQEIEKLKESGVKAFDMLNNIIDNKIFI